MELEKNIDDAIKVADENARGIITTAQKNDYNAIKNWNDNHPNDKVVTPDAITYIAYKGNVELFRITYSWVKSSIPMLDIPELNTLFTTGQVSTDTIKSFFDGRIIKKYNGLGSEAPKLHFVYILAENPNIKPVIKIYETAYRKGEGDINYVKDVSLEDV